MVGKVHLEVVRVQEAMGLLEERALQARVEAERARREAEQEALQAEEARRVAEQKARAEAEAKRKVKMNSKDLTFLASHSQYFP